MSWQWYEKDLGNGSVVGCWSTEPITLGINNGTIRIESDSDTNVLYLSGLSNIYLIERPIGDIISAEIEDLIEDL
jgi:hypothetical protein